MGLEKIIRKYFTTVHFLKPIDFCKKCSWDELRSALRLGTVSPCALRLLSLNPSRTPPFSRIKYGTGSFKRKQPTAK